MRGAHFEGGLTGSPFASVFTSVGSSVDFLAACSSPSSAPDLGSTSERGEGVERTELDESEGDRLMISSEVSVLFSLRGGVYPGASNPGISTPMAIHLRATRFSIIIKRRAKSTATDLVQVLVSFLGPGGSRKGGANLDTKQIRKALCSQVVGIEYLPQVLR